MVPWALMHDKDLEYEIVFAGECILARAIVGFVIY